MLTAQQLVTYALQIVKAPGFTAQAGDFLNARLSSLAKRYDFDVLLAETTISVISGQQQYSLPADYDRGNQYVYYISGLPQVMRQISLQDYLRVNVGSLAMAYPQFWSADTSVSPPQVYLTPMPNTSFSMSVRYWAQPVDITNPATSNVVPWLPDSDYLLTVLAADLMALTDDTRLVEYRAMSDKKLDSYLKMQGDRENFARTVQLGNSFRSGSGTLPPSKLTGF